MSKRTVDELQAELQEAKRIAEKKEYEENAISKVDPVFAAWEKKLEPLKGRKNGAWKLRLYPPAGRRWRNDSLLSAVFPFIMRSPWTLRGYFESHSRKWDDPCIFYADSLEELKPENPELLRLFGVMFYIQESSLKWDPLECCRKWDVDCSAAVADPFTPMHACKVGKEIVDLTNPDTVSRLANSITFKQELPLVAGAESVAELRKKRDALQAEIDKLEELVELAHDQVYPYSHLDPTA
jgi:hypothetical protein